VHPTRTVVVVVDDTETGRERLREALEQATHDAREPLETVASPEAGLPAGLDPVVVDRALLVRLLKEQSPPDQRDDVVRALARTVSHQLNQPLALLLGLFELQAAGMFSPEQSEEVWADLRSAASELAARVDRLGRAQRYETQEIAGYVLLDLDRAV